MIINQLTYMNTEAVIADIKVTQVGTTIYQVGETFSLNGYQIIGVYTNLEEQDITNQCTFSPNRALTIEDTEIIISYKEKNIVQAIQIAEEQLVNYVMVYDNGNECSDITGTWQGRQGDTRYPSGTFSKEATCLRYGRESTSSYGEGIYYTVNNIDITDYVGYDAKVHVCYLGKSTSYDAWSTNAVFQSSMTTTSPIYFIDSPHVEGNRIYSRSVSLGSTHFHHLLFSAVDNNTSMNRASCKLGLATWCGAWGNASMGVKTYEAYIYKQDNWQELCRKANLSPDNYNDEDALCADSAAMQAILFNENAIKYMLTQCTGSFMTTFIRTTTALNTLESSSFKTQVYANEHWAKFLNMAA